MKKALKIIGIALGILIVLIIATVVIVSLTFDPNQYKGQITRVVKEQTGRELTIDGKISLSFFPWIGAEVRSVSLSNAPGFGAQPFAQVGQLGIKVKLLPLLHKQVVVDQIIIDGLKLNLAKNRAGHGNWEDLSGKTAPQAAAKPGEQPSASPIAGLLVSGVTIRNSELVWDDQVSGKHYTIRNLDFSTGEISPGRMTDVQLGLDLDSGSPPLHTRVTLKARLAVDPAKQTLDAPSLLLEAAGVTLKVSDLKGSKIIDAPTFTGKLEIPAFDARSLMNKLGIKYETADKNALTKVAFSGPFSESTEALELKGFRLNLDDTTLNGSFALRNFAHPEYRFDLSLDDINLDHYLPPSPPAETKSAGQPAATAPRPVVVLPLSALRALDVNGTLRIKKLTATGLHSSDINVRLAAKGGSIALNPMQANLYGGNYDGSVNVDARGRVPSFAMDEKLTAVQIGPLLRDMQAFNYFTGTGNLAFSLNAHGIDAREITSSLNGSGSFSVHDGKIEGVDLIKIINQTRALAMQVQGRQVRAQTATGDATVFSKIAGTVRVVNGVAQNNDLVLESPNLGATGQGSASLVSQNLDYTLRVAINQDNPDKRTIVPVIIRGPFSALQYSVDWGEIAKDQAQKAIKKELRKQLDEGLRKLFQ